MKANNFINWIESKYGIESFMEWISVWLESEEWDFPAMLNEIPEELLNPFKEEGTYYRGMTIGDNLHLPANSEACSWTPNMESAEYFAGKDNYVSIIQDDGDTAYAVIYELKGLAINLNKIIDTLVNHIEENGLEFDDYEEIKDVYESFQSEEEFITGFNIDEVSELSKVKC